MDPGRLTSCRLLTEFELTAHTAAAVIQSEQVRGTVGAGDATVGGFLSGMLRGLSLVRAQPVVEWLNLHV